MIELAKEQKALTAFIEGLTNFGIYFGISIGFLVAFKFLYMMMTPHDEMKLIKEEKNTAAAVALGGALVGYAIAVASAASNSIGYIDFAMWGCVAVVAQVTGFFLVRGLMMPKIVKRIENNEIPAALLLAAVSISVGLLNAACMTY